MAEFEILRGDCRERMREIPDAAIDAVVTDPPYELGFMGKSWDSTGIANDVAMWREVLRVLKPGGHVVAFGGSRTYHRMTCAIEDAGFEIRDSLQWLYGTGFPKSLDVSKAIDKGAGAVRLVVGRGASSCPDLAIGNPCACAARYGAERSQSGSTVHAPETAPATAAAAWSGWGTALKPAHEPIVLARKPLIGTVAANVQAHGTGALNIDGCRIEGGEPALTFDRQAGARSRAEYRTGTVVGAAKASDVGRWPANVILDEEAGALLDEQSGERGAAAPVRGTERSAAVETGTITGARKRVPGVFHADSGGASRFFYCAKTSAAEREAGLEAFPKKSAGELTDRADDTDGLKSPRAGAGRGGGRANGHPTVKPISLMRWLVRLITPPGGIVLDPFTGSGTTGCAAVLEGHDFLGCELGEEYAAIAEARIAYHAGAQRAA